MSERRSPAQRIIENIFPQNNIEQFELLFFFSEMCIHDGNQQLHMQNYNILVKYSRQRWPSLSKEEDCYTITYCVEMNKPHWMKKKSLLTKTMKKMWSQNAKINIRIRRVIFEKK